MSRHRRQQARNFVGELPDFCFPARARETLSEAERAMGEPPARWVGLTAQELGWNMALFAEQLGMTAEDVAEAIERDDKAMREAEREDF